MSLARLGHSGGGAPSGQGKTSGLYNSAKGQKATDGKTVGGPGIGTTESGAGPVKSTTNLPADLGGAALGARANLTPKRKPAGIAAGDLPGVLEPGGQCNP